MIVAAILFGQLTAAFGSRVLFGGDVRQVAWPAVCCVDWFKLVQRHVRVRPCHRPPRFLVGLRCDGLQSVDCDPGDSLGETVAVSLMPAARAAATCRLRTSSAASPKVDANAMRSSYAAP
jgi:hypothetical protein